MVGDALLRLVGAALYPVGRDGRAEPGAVTRGERRRALLVLLAIIAGLIAVALGMPLALTALLR